MDPVGTFLPFMVLAQDFPALEISDKEPDLITEETANKGDRYDNW